jgi:hypothetical protein
LAGVCDDAQFFKHVSLGPHEELIRQMILNRDAVEAEDYPMMIFALYFQGQRMPDLMFAHVYASPRFEMLSLCFYRHYYNDLRLGPSPFAGIYAMARWIHKSLSEYMMGS